MTPSLRFIFLILALVCFVLAAFSVPRLSWRDAGFAFLVLAFIVP